MITLCLKRVQNSDFGAKTTVTAQNSNFRIQNLNFKLLFALLTSNITYMKHLRSMGAGEASADEETSKNRSANTFPTTFLTDTTSTEAWKQAQVAKNRVLTLSVPQISRYLWPLFLNFFKFEVACFVLNTLPTHPQTHFQQLSSLTTSTKACKQALFAKNRFLPQSVPQSAVTSSRYFWIF